MAGALKRTAGRTRQTSWIAAGRAIQKRGCCAALALRPSPPRTPRQGAAQPHLPASRRMHGNERCPSFLVAGRDWPRAVAPWRLPARARY
eukprot:5542988-Prymnesium_polylepis.2